jgi:hypothetical protein
MTDERTVDEQLVATLNQVLDAVYQAKQAAWSAAPSPIRDDLRELVTFLIDQSGRLMVAEGQIDGRSPGVRPPSSHQRGNLVAEAGGDHAKAVSLLVDQLTVLTIDARERARTISDAGETAMLTELAEGVEARIARLRST